MPVDMSSRTLRMAFSTDEDKNVVIPINCAKPTQSAETVKALMDSFISAQPLAKHKLVGKVGAEFVFTTKNELF